MPQCIRLARAKLVFPRPISNSTQSDTTIDFASGQDRINLAAFGALAFLHLTSASKSVPPHTLAWIYNPASNETIVYVNPTDRSLDIGDADLVEIHLQGVVSVAESDFVYQSEAAASGGGDRSLRCGSRPRAMGQFRRRTASMLLSKRRRTKAHSGRLVCGPCLPTTA